MIELTFCSRLTISRERLWAFHEDPQTALPILAPPGQSIRLAHIDRPYGLGSRVIIESGPWPLRLRWVARISQFDPPECFADVQEKGPFAYWLHQHRFLTDGPDASLLIDHITARLPAGLLGRTLMQRFVVRKLTSMFHHRHRATASALRADISPAEVPR